MKHLYYPSADGMTTIHAQKWEPSVQPKAVLQLCHGMQEYVQRYQAFAEYLAGYGFVVVGSDHLGHGSSVTGPEKLGFFAEREGNRCLLDDLYTLQKQTQSEYPHLPYFFLGHSMGSFLARQYIALHGSELTGAVIMGTGSQPEGVLAFGRTLCRLIALVHGWQYRSPLVIRTVSGAYNKRIVNARTPNDWLTKDTAIVDAYEKDPLCAGFHFTVNGYYNMFLSISRCQSRKTLGAVPSDLPLLLVSGEEDPVGNYGAGVKKAFAQYQKIGLHKVQMKLYPGDRHEILNETDRMAVFEELRIWLETAMA